MIDDILFVHPKDIADRNVDITDRDITTNVPYDPRCHMAFDHHASEAIKLAGETPDNLVLDPTADSAARVVYRYYGGRERFPEVSQEMMAAVDKADSARFTEQEILDPSGWVLLNFIMDPRTGLGRFNCFKIGNFELMMQLIDYCREHPVDEILNLPDVRERVELYLSHRDRAAEQIRRCSTVHDNVAVLDLRNENTIYACNRFMVYAVHPACNCSIHVIWGRGAQNTVFAIGHSILNRTATINIGELCLKYDGGGHAGAGTVQVDHSDADRVLHELIDRINAAESPPTVLSDTDDRDMEADEDDRVALDDEQAAAENVLEGVLAETGMHLLPTKQDIRELHARLDRIEQLIAELSPVSTAH
jgi:nanoRNase/pAp phosphatase (c-di-AMP/oligoRNAs hydrolase)